MYLYIVYGMFKDTPYMIKKFGNWIRAIPVYFSSLIPILYILAPIIFIIVMYLDYNKWEFDGDFVMAVFFLWLLIVYGIILLKEILKLKNVKNYKLNWWWMVKKVKVTSIQKTRANKGGKWNYVDVYYVEAEDSGIIYHSNGYAKWVLLWTSVEQLQLLYAKYWYIFNESHDQKDEILRKLDESIAEKEYEVENAWFISKMTKWKELSKLKEDREVISYWYIAPYWQIDDKKVTVWDMVDIYLDPDKPERYRVDIDFLFWD